MIRQKINIFLNELCTYYDIEGLKLKADLDLG